MLEHLGYAEAGEAIVRAIARVLADTPIRTSDLGGKASTHEVSEQIVEALHERSSSGTEEA
jgi:tartrate dehydrogenase/decarboxylase / D-malate dehydrogenase